MGTRTYYQVLDVSELATSEEIRASYLILSKVLHPDRFDPKLQHAEWNKANELLKELNEAYAVLRHPATRRLYDGSIDPIEPAEEPTDASPSASTEDERSKPKPPEKPGSQSPAFGSGEFDLTRLSQDVIAKLRKRQLAAGDDDCFVLQAPTTTPMILGVLVGAALLAVAVFAADSYRWTDQETRIYSALSIVGIGLALGATAKLLVWRAAALKPGRFVSPTHLLTINHSCVRFRWLWSLDSFNVTDYTTNGDYSHSIIEIGYGDDTEQIRFSDQRQAELCVKFLQRWESIIRRAITENDTSTLSQLNDLGECTSEHLGVGPQWYGHRLAWPLLVSAMVFAALSPFGINRLNLYNDDRLGWAAALAANTPSGFLGYIQAHPEGRWLSDARFQEDRASWEVAQKANTASGYREYLNPELGRDRRWRKQAIESLDRVYAAATDKYEASLSENYDESSVRAIRSLLDGAKITGNPEVPVLFKGSNAIPADYVDRLVRSWGKPKIFRVGESFSPTQMRSRENRILGNLQTAFGRILSEDLLMFRAAEAGAMPLLEVDYEVRPSGRKYEWTHEGSLPPVDREYFPGVTFSWSCTVRSRLPGITGHKFYLSSSPAKDIEVGDRAVYEAMVDSAFNDLQTEIVRRFGLNR